MTTYDGSIIFPEHGVNREQQNQVPWIGWDRDWDELWGHVVNPFGGWDIDFGENFGSPQKGTFNRLTSLKTQKVHLLGCAPAGVRLIGRRIPMRVIMHIASKMIFITVF
jgi:hypothetical protein